MDNNLASVIQNSHTRNFEITLFQALSCMVLCRFQDYLIGFIENV